MEILGVIFIAFAVFQTANAIDFGRVGGDCFNMENGLKCSTDCMSVGRCIGGHWFRIKDCLDGQHCETSNNGECVNGPPGNGNGCSPTNVGNEVMCSGGGYRVPNLADESCSTYFNCTESGPQTESQNCPYGLYFDYCSGYCITNNSITEQCTQIEPPVCSGTNAKFLTLPNTSLGYACFEDTIWWTNTTPESARCINGNDVNRNCMEPGRLPLSGTNCGYRRCDLDLTYQDVPCPNNYRYDHIARGCVAGACSPQVRRDQKSLTVKLPFKRP